MATSKKRGPVSDFAGVVKKTRFEIASGDLLDEAPITPQSLPLAAAPSIAESATTACSTSKRPKKYVCDFEGCGKAFDRPVRLQAHQRVHTGDRPFVCEVEGCPKAFFKAEHLKAHVQNKHEEDASYVCTYVVGANQEGEEFECGKAFTTATRLRRHLAAHEEKESLRCQEAGCGLLFRKMETLQRHIKKDHLHENAFRCSHVVFEDGSDVPEECAAEFATQGQLKAHENREHAGLRYFCEICSPPKLTSGQNAQDDPMDMFEELDQVGFKTYADLQAHQKTAHPPQCPTCGQACESKRALAAHMDIEHSSLTERQKYPCTYADCGRSFTRAGNLKVHIQNVHVKHKKFICGAFDLTTNEKCAGWDGRGCGMGFGTKANLENHTRTQHLGLPTLLKRRSAGKHDDNEANAHNLSANQNAGEHAEQNALALLTGHGYEKTRPIACWMADCAVRFMRTYDLVQHMELRHGWLVDDVNDRLAEDEALSGGQFWIGGAAGQSEGPAHPEALKDVAVYDLNDEPTHAATMDMDLSFLLNDLAAQTAGELHADVSDRAAVMLDPALQALA